MKLIDEILEDFSALDGVIATEVDDFKNHIHILKLKEVMSSYGIQDEVINPIIRTLTEKDDGNGLDADGLKDANNMGLTHLGGVYWGKKGKPATHMAKDGKLVKKGDDDDGKKTDTEQKPEVKPKIDANPHDKKDDSEKDKPKKQDLSDEPHTGDVAHDLKVDADNEKKKEKELAIDAKKQKAFEHRQKEFIDKTKVKLDQVVWTPKEDKQNFIVMLDNIIGGNKLSKSELSLLNKYVRIKKHDDEVALYLAGGVTDDDKFKQGARIKVKLGTSFLSNEIKKQMLDAGMKLGDAVTTKGSVDPKIKTKDVTLGKLAKGRIREEIVEKELNSDGDVISVTVGGHKMRKQPVQSKSSLVEAYKKQGLSDESAETTALQTIAGQLRYNSLIDKYGSLDKVDSVDLVEGADTSTTEGRKRIADEGPTVIHDGLKEMLDKNPPITEAEQSVLNDISSINKIDDPGEYEAACVEALKKMSKVESMRKGTSDVAETFVMLIQNKRGTPCMAPFGETVKVADLIVFPKEDLDPSDPKYLDKLIAGGEMVVMMTDAGGLSVKKDGGAASAFKAKLDLSTFKNEETRGHLQNILDIHNYVIPTTKSELTQDNISEGQSRLDATEQWARDNGIVDGEIKFKDGRTPDEWAEQNVKDWEKKGMYPKGLSDENKKLMVAGLAQMARGGLLIEMIHNKDLDYQEYSNANVNISTGEIEMSNGIKCVNEMNYVSNTRIISAEDKNGNYIMRPNHIFAGRLHKVCR